MGSNLDGYIGVIALKNTCYKGKMIRKEIRKIVIAERDRLSALKMNKIDLPHLEIAPNKRSKPTHLVLLPSIGDDEHCFPGSRRMKPAENRALKKEKKKPAENLPKSMLEFCPNLAMHHHPLSVPAKGPWLPARSTAPGQGAKRSGKGQGNEGRGPFFTKSGLSLTALKSVAAAAAAARRSLLPCSTTTCCLMGWGHVCAPVGPHAPRPRVAWPLHARPPHPRWTLLAQLSRQPAATD